MKIMILAVKIVEIVLPILNAATALVSQVRILATAVRIVVDVLQLNVAMALVSQERIKVIVVLIAVVVLQLYVATTSVNLERIV
jgi:hypothetical protein